MSESPLNPDELAAAYLISRDVPCPNCAYNRRGGVTAACPECGHVLTILHEDGGWKKNFTVLGSRYLTILLLLIIVHTLLNGHSVFFWLTMMINGSAPGWIGYFYLIQGTIGVMAFLTICVITLRTRRKVRSGNPITPTAAAAPMLAYLIVTTILWLSGFMTTLL